jgi:hypothetical protein
VCVISSSDHGQMPVIRAYLCFFCHRAEFTAVSASLALKSVTFPSQKSLSAWFFGVIINNCPDNSADPSQTAF